MGVGIGGVRWDGVGWGVGGVGRAQAMICAGVCPGPKAQEETLGKRGSETLRFATTCTPIGWPAGVQGQRMSQ